MNTTTPRVFIAATRQNDGKTTTSLGLLAALQKGAGAEAVAAAFADVADAAEFELAAGGAGEGHQQALFRNIVEIHSHDVFLEIDM